MFFFSNIFFISLNKGSLEPLCTRMPRRSKRQITNQSNAERYSSSWKFYEHLYFELLWLSYRFDTKNNATDETSHGSGATLRWNSVFPVFFVILCFFYTTLISISAGNPLLERKITNRSLNFRNTIKICMNLSTKVWKINWRIKMYGKYLHKRL